MGTLIKHNFKFFSAIMIDGTFPVMAIVLSDVEKREYNRDKANLSINEVSNLSLLSYEKNRIFIESRNEKPELGRCEVAPEALPNASSTR
jgi:hypothetical protein